MKHAFTAQFNINRSIVGRTGIYVQRHKSELLTISFIGDTINVYKFGKIKSWSSILGT